MEAMTKSTKRKSSSLTSSTRKTTAFDEKVELIGLGVKECVCRLERSHYFQIRRTRPKDEIRTITSHVYLEKHNDVAFDGIIEFAFGIKDRANQTVPLEIKCSYQSHFHAPKGFERAQAEKFLGTYLSIIAWPYFRQLVADMTGRMSVSPITLPLLPESDSEEPNDHA
jgi:preprotein translocase subunit SecB